VDEFGRIGVVEQIHGNRDAFAQADERSWHGAVVADGGDGVVLGDIGEHVADAQGDIGGFGGGFRRTGAAAGGQQEAGS
jgi:hypothetical protein